MKICSRCKQEKELSDFSPRKDRPGQYCSHCRWCEKLRKFSRRTVHRPPEQLLMLTKICNGCGVEKFVSEFGRRKDKGIPRSVCNACSVSRVRDWCKKNPAKARALVRRYQTRNWEKVLKKNLAYVKKRKARDPAFKMALAVRVRIRAVLRGISKSADTMRLLGCTSEELKAHLESQFQPGMAWENYGVRGWHMDHIKPCASFDLADPAQQRACFHYTNLQPLWAKENLTKGAK